MEQHIQKKFGLDVIIAVLTERLVVDDLGRVIDLVEHMVGCRLRSANDPDGTILVARMARALVVCEPALYKQFSQLAKVIQDFARLCVPVLDRLPLELGKKVFRIWLASEMAVMPERFRDGFPVLPLPRGSYMLADPHTEYMRAETILTARINRPEAYHLN